MSGGLSGYLPEAQTLPSGQIAPPAPTLDPAILGATSVPRPDGGVDLVMGDDEPAEVQLIPHDGNLAEVLLDSELAAIAMEAIEGIEADIESNRETYEIYDRGMKLLALKPGERGDEPFEGASAAVHTLLKEAVIRYASEASGELIPAAGPVRCQVIGDSTDETEELAERKQSWLNYYLTEADADFPEDFDAMLLQQGLYGSMFRKVWADPTRNGDPTSRYLTPYDLVTSANTTSMTQAPRITQIEPVPRAEIIRLRLKGWYLDVDLVEPDGEGTPAGQRSGVNFRTPSDRPEDAEHVLYHCHCLLDLAGFEHVDQDGVPTGLPLPYVVTIDRDSQQVLRLARDWNEGDTDFRRRETFLHYRYMPGFGFLGWGLIHLVGSTTDDLSVLRRQAINAFTLASFPGGFRVKGASRSEDSDMTIGPCEFKEIDTGGQPIQNAIMPLTYRDVPPSFPMIVEDLSATGQRLASIGDAAVGDGREDSLPGTVIALINQATKLQSAVIKRQHRTLQRELRLLADLFGRDTAAKYPYLVNGVRGQAVASDFQDNADVLPVSDPNVPTQTHRLSLAQGIYTMAQSSQGMLDVREAAMDFLRALGKTDADIARLMPQPGQGTPADPVTEFMGLLKGRPLAVGPAQDHAAHIQAHMVQMGTPGVQQTPAGPQLIAHMAEHMGAFYRAQVATATGIQLQPGQPMPPAQENQVAAAVAAASSKLTASLAQLAPAAAAPQADPTKMMELQLKSRELDIKEADSERKAEASARSEQAEMLRQEITVNNDKMTRITELLTGLMEYEGIRVQALGEATGKAFEAAGTATAGAAAAHGATMSAHAAQSRAGADHSRAAADAIGSLAEHQIAIQERLAGESQGNAPQGNS